MSVATQRETRRYFMVMVEEAELRPASQKKTKVKRERTLVMAAAMEKHGPNGPLKRGKMCLSKVPVSAERIPNVMPMRE